jgi:hypothetical protein
MTIMFVERCIACRDGCAHWLMMRGRVSLVTYDEMQGMHQAQHMCNMQQLLC